MPTLLSTAAVQGFGLFTSKPASVFILPGEPGRGIVFRRADHSLAIPADVAHLAPQPPGVPARNTTLAAAHHTPPITVLTTEHILSALVGLGITDAIIELDGPEVPIMDGSAQPFVEAIRKAGIESDQAPQRGPLTLTREIVIESGPARIVARSRAAPGASYTYELDYGPGAPIPAQSATWTREGEGSGSASTYAREVAPARTFCLEGEAQQMRAMGLFKDLSPRDMLVIGAHGPIDNSYRFENEPARHKLLDLIGDLALIGGPIQADITATRAGHAMNHALAKAVVEAASQPRP